MTSTVQHSTAQYSTVQYSTVQYSTHSANLQLPARGRQPLLGHQRPHGPPHQPRATPPARQVSLSDIFWKIIHAMALYSISIVWVVS